MSRDSGSRASRASRASHAQAPGKARARARVSLKMQAIGFLSRREHSRQELRAKLLDSLRKRAREEAALAAAAAQAAQELEHALREQPSNGIDDAFAAPVAASARDAKRSTDVTPTSRAALDTLRLANGTGVPARLKAALARHVDAAAMRSTATQGSSRVDDVGAGDLEVAAPDAGLELTDPEAAVDQLLDWLAANKYLSEERFVESRVNARSRKQGALLIKLELSRHGLTLEPEQAAQLRETEFVRAQALWQRKFGAIATDAGLRAKQARFLAARGFAADVVRRIVGGRDDD